jgi:pimeloyl-ACP methyl ester carboxylesterase
MTAAARPDDFKLDCTVAGRGQPVVLLHGFPLDRTMWEAQGEALAPRFRVIAPDLRGFGKSKAPPGPVSMEQLADDVAALLDRLKIRKAAIVGLSMGGYVAFAFARKHAARATAFAFCDTKAAADTPEARKGRAEMMALVADQGTAPIAERMIPRLLAPETLRQRPEVADRLRRMILRAPVEGVRGALQGMADRPDSTPVLSTLAVPTLFIVGAHDALSPPDEAGGMCARVPNGRLAVIPDAGHMAPMENAEAVNAALADFLDGLTS